ncbi:MAG: hypothetical protein WCO56_19190 [Verrucomicrobiota bacterium]
MNNLLKTPYFGLTLISLWLLLAPGARSQGEPHIGYLNPADGRQGTTFQATIGGQNLYATGVYVSGTGFPVTVHALRKDGFTGPITLRLKEAPKGFTLIGAQIPENQDLVKCTLDSSPSSRMEPFSLHVEGQATIQGREIIRSALPADDMMQAFAYRHLVPAQELKVAVTGRFQPGAASQILSAVPVKITSGGTAKLRFSLPTGPLVNQVQFELSEPPDGISITEASATENLLQTDAAKIKPGYKGNLIIQASAEAPLAAGTEAPPANRRHISLGALPAIPVEIVR